MDPFISDVSSLVAAGAHLRHADRPFLPDLLAHQARAALHQGAAGGRTGRRDQVVRPPLPQRQPAGASGLCVALPLQVSEPPPARCRCKCRWALCRFNSKSPIWYKGKSFHDCPCLPSHKTIQNHTH